MRRACFSTALVLLLALAGAAAQADDMAAALQSDLAPLQLVTATRHHKPGDLVNVGLVGSRDDIIAAMQAAGWAQPVPVTLRSSARIVSSVAFRRAYDTAPVSTLLYLGRRQDLAFEKEVGRSASQRHHVRFWKLRDDGPDGRALWLGAASFDRGVGLSHRNGAVTHHISGDVDAERNFLIAELARAQRVAAQFDIAAEAPLRARNGGGDPYWTDGHVAIAILTPAAAPAPAP